MFPFLPNPPTPSTYSSPLTLTLTLVLALILTLGIALALVLALILVVALTARTPRCARVLRGTLPLRMFLGRRPTRAIVRRIATPPRARRRGEEGAGRQGCTGEG
jgi:hypothetical protein